VTGRKPAYSRALTHRKKKFHKNENRKKSKIPLRVVYQDAYIQDGLIPMSHSIFEPLKTSAVYYNPRMEPNTNGTNPVEYIPQQNVPLNLNSNTDDASSLVQIAIKDEVMSEGTLSEGKPSAPASKMQSCKVCGKVLSSASSYYVHMKLHSGSKPYQCTVCEAAFCRKPYLEVHMRVHTGERPFQCDQCLKRFTQKSSLNTHKRVHTGERPYACELCDKRFAVKSYVIAHRWSHVSDRPIACHTCSMTFTSKTQYAIHLRTHSPNKKFECSVCGRTFAKDSYLIRHHHRTHTNNPFRHPN